MAISVLCLFLALMGSSVKKYLVSFLVFNHLTEEKIAGCFDYVLTVVWLLVFCDSSLP